MFKSTAQMRFSLICLYLLLYLDWVADLLFERRMQVPQLPLAHELRATQLEAFWNFAPCDANSDPAP